MLDPRAARSFVIVISGTSGAGKTSLVREVAALLGEAVCLHFDDYQSVSEYPPDLAAWVVSGADPNEWRTPQLAADLEALRRGQTISLPDGRGSVGPRPYVVVEDPFGRARREMASHMDFVAYLDLPLEIAMARKLRREVNAAVSESGPQAGVDRLNRFLSGFLDGAWRASYLAANASAHESCDFVLDGMRPLDELAREIVARVQSC